MLIYIATQNKNKLKEMRAILEPLGIEAEPHPAYDQLNVEETGATFEENASIKAIALSHWNRWEEGLCFPPQCLADDSGLVVDALGGAPGVYSARYALLGGKQGPSSQSADELNNALLLKNMQGIEDRRARFVCVIALALDGKVIKTFRGECEGSIAHKVAGSGGFGYDPLFLLPDGRTMAQLSPDEKNTISHRAQALSKLSASLRAKRAGPVI